MTFVDFASGLVDGLSQWEVRAKRSPSIGFPAVARTPGSRDDDTIEYVYLSDGALSRIWLIYELVRGRASACRLRRLV